MARHASPIADRLPPEAVRTALAETNVPLHIAVRITEQLAAAKAEGRISDILLVNLDQNVQLLIDYLGAGLLFGNVPIVKQNFSLVTIGIVVVSLLPVVVSAFRRTLPETQSG